MEYFRNSMGPVGKCLSDSRIDERNVHDVVLVGGSSASRQKRFTELVVLPSTHTETVLPMSWKGRDYVIGQMWKE